MKNKLILTMLTISIVLSGCIYTGNESKINTTGELVPGEFVPGKLIKINYVDNSTILNGEDFPDFKLMSNVYYIAPENLSLTLETEMGHGVYEIDAGTTVPHGYRTYGESELYNSSERYLLLQYKAFDSNESLNNTIDATAKDVYIKHGYKYKPLNNTRGRVVVLESSVKNHTDMNVTIILFGSDTVIGKIGVQDFKNKSLNESLKILNIVFDRLHVKTKDIKAAKLSTIRSSNMSKNMSSYEDEI